MKWALIHKGHIAFLLNRLPEHGSIIASSDCEGINGEVIVSGEPIFCGSCGDLLMGPDLRMEKIVGHNA